MSIEKRRERKRKRGEEIEARQRRREEKKRPRRSIAGRCDYYERKRRPEADKQICFWRPYRPDVLTFMPRREKKKRNRDKKKPETAGIQRKRQEGRGIAKQFQ